MRASRADIDALPVFPLIDPHFLTENEYRQLRDFAERNSVAFGETDTHDYWKGRTLTPSDIADEGVRQIFRATRDRILAKVSKVLAAELGPQPTLYSDLINFARWPPGYELQPHADSENPNGVEHPFPWRDFATVMYLNDDYEGGEIFFPNLGLELKPQPRTLIVFPGTLFFLHGVKRVTRGMRHTIASFLTFDAEHQYEF
jgi:predicted 2-oxoglutarate/Fe(II)-dependent dioxygenase YbiX